MLGNCRSGLGDSPMRAWRRRTRNGQLKEAVFQRVREVLFCQAPCSRSELKTARQLGGHRNTTLCPHGLSPGVLLLALIGMGSRTDSTTTNNCKSSDSIILRNIVKDF